MHVWSGKRRRVRGVCVCVFESGYMWVCSRYGDEVRMMKPIPRIRHHVRLICWVFLKGLLIITSKLN